MKLSWTAMQNFLSCQRKYELKSIEHLSRIKGVDGRDMFLGSAVHAGINAALLLLHKNANNTNILNELKAAGAKAAREYINGATIVNKTVWSYEDSCYYPDFDYYTMMGDLAVLAPELTEYHIENIGLGTRWQTVCKGEVLGYGWYDEEIQNADLFKTEWLLEPALEWDIEAHFPETTRKFYNLDAEDGLKGRLDAVLRDMNTDELVIVDWKVRTSFPFDEMAWMDGQLHLYAAILNELGGHIASVCMYQLKSKKPSPASISKKVGKDYGKPNTGAASYDTTWAVWCRTLPAGINPADYEELMKPKLKTNADFVRPVFNTITKVTSSLAWRNAAIVVASIRNANGYAAIQSSYACGRCDFWRLCSGVLRTGGDPTPIIEHEYVREIIEHDERSAE